MRKLIVFLALMIIPARLPAFSTKDLLGLVAMPLAVAAVSDVAGVPQDQLADIVSTLNQADVPPDQFVDVVRYVPVTYGQPATGPTLADFLRSEFSNGVTGPALITSLTRRLQTKYNVTPRLVMTQEPTTFVVERDYIPTTNAFDTADNPLALIALPLAVAAVSDVSGIPQDQLANLVATLNNANVPVTQEIQVVRYAPVALTADNGQPFVDFVQTQVNQGITGPALVPVVTERIQSFVPEQRIVMAPPPERAEIDERFIAPVQVPVQARARGNPHGGPPGQIKKQLGLQTGAEVVHGARALPAPMISSSPVVVERPRHTAIERGHGEGHGHGNGRGHEKNVQFVAPPVAAPQPAVVQPAPVMVPPGNPGRGHGEGGGGKEHGNGNGKGHGKDH